MTVAKKLGLKRLEKLTPKACRDRAKFLRKRLERGLYKGQTEAKARAWASWYNSKAKALKKAA